MPYSIEHKLGIHASPTCTMIFGDHGGAIGYLIGEENRGMACDVHDDESRAARRRTAGRRHRRARLSAGAVAYASERRQGRSPAMLGERDGADHRASRRQAHAHDHARPHRRPRAASATRQRSRSIVPSAARDKERAARRPSLALIAHADREGVFDAISASKSLRLACRCTAAWALSRKPARRSIIAMRASLPIYEGTNGIQAIDLVTRKLSLDGGAAVEAYLSELGRIVEAVNATNDPALGWSGTRLEEAVNSLTRATRWMLSRMDKDVSEALAGATPYLRLFAFAAGGCLLAQQALAALRLNADAGPRVALARFFAENLAVQAVALERTIVEGAPSVISADAVLA